VTGVDEQAVLADLDPDQLAAVLSDGGPLCIVAPAGSGKTRVLTRRVARRILDGSAEPNHVLVVTFTRRAAGELASRLRAASPRQAVTAGTFHGIAHRLLRQRAEDLRKPAPALLTNRERLVEEVMADVGLRRGGAAGAARDITGEIDWARARLVAPERYQDAARAAERRTSVPPAQIAEVYTRYEEAKRRRKVIDFDDLLSGLRREIERDPAYAAAVRWRFRHLFVDEFQDVNPLQHALLEAWRGGRDDLCVVGDPSQAIYGWTGADGGWLERFAEHHPRATVLHLGHSHRSSPQIVDFGRAVLTGTPNGAPRSSRPDGPAPAVHHAADARAEARAVVDLARQARRPGGRWSAIAVLARTHAQLQPVADAMATAGIPTRARASSPLADAGIAPAVAELRTRTGPGALRDWLDETPTGADDDAAGEEELPPADALRLLRRAVEELVEQDTLADGPALATWLATGGRGDRIEDDRDAISLVTFHAAKGLEWPTVVVIGAVPGLVPHGSARRPEAREEERRLFHVAVTRAQHELHVTWFGEAPSPFLPPIDAVEPPMPAPAELSLPTARPPGAPDPVLVALQAWRHDTARAARIEELAVVDDPTLAAIAAARPTTIESLAAVSGFGPLMARRHGPRLLAVLEPLVRGAAP
jgi:DNA helicase-2/ATP-dependent DNA helicase PcrA